MKQRVITALWLLPLLLVVVIWAPDWVIAIVVAGVALLGAMEFYRMAAHRGEQPLALVGYFFVLAFVVNAFFENDYTGPVLAAAVILPLVWLSFRRRATVFADWAWTLAGALYMGWMLSHYVALRRLDEGRGWVLLALLSTFACDAAAYLVGRAWGRHRLAPTISPSKTWEGAVGGLVAAAAAALVLYVIMDSLGLSLPLGYGWAILLGCLIGVFAQLGDLTESLLKRRAGVKDSGSLLPGHGGILDRIDSVIFAGLVAYYFALSISGGWFA